MYILALETATEACSVALLANTEITSRYEYQPRQHTRLIIPMIDELLKKANISLADLDALAISIGPGSFTGIRIATGIIQALSFAHQIPVILISTLQIMAQTAYDKYSTNNILVLQDAHMDEIYVGQYQCDEQKIMQALTADQLIKPDALVEYPSECLLVGSAWLKYQAAINQSVKNRLNVDTECHPQAKSMLKIAKIMFEGGKIVDAEKVIPIYLRTGSAWKK